MEFCPSALIDLVDVGHGKGMGMVALQNISAGTVICTESPLLVLDGVFVQFRSASIELFLESLAVHRIGVIVLEYGVQNHIVPGSKPFLGPSIQKICLQHFRHRFIQVFGFSNNLRTNTNKHSLSLVY